MDQIEKRVWGYCRCGGADQTDIENQVEQLKQYAESCGYTLSGYTVGHGSSLEPDSPDMAEIERAAKEYAADTLLINAASRLSRKTVELLGSLKYIAQIPMNVECVNGTDLSADSPFKDSVLAMSECMGSVGPEYEAKYEEDYELDLNDGSEELGR